MAVSWSDEVDEILQETAPSTDAPPEPLALFTSLQDCLSELEARIARGTVVTLQPGPEPKAGGPPERPFAHPYYWAAFILIGDPD